MTELDPKQRQARELEQQIQEFLKRGGRIQRIPEGQRSDPQELKNQWGKPRKKKPVDKSD